MKVVILAGGLGTRLAEETEVRPKPMVEIGGRPILWHIMKHYAQLRVHGVRRRPRLQGRGHQALLPRLLARCNGTSPCRPRRRGRSTRWTTCADDWTVHLIDTGCTRTPAAASSAWRRGCGDETFMLTYGDGVCERRPARAAALPPRARQARDGDRGASAGALRRADVRRRAGRRAVHREAADRARAGSTAASSSSSPACSTTSTATRRAWRPSRWSGSPRDGQLMAYTHDGFWQCMDTLRDVRYLRSIWESGNAPWITW